jgi:hypothetical protein
MANPLSAAQMVRVLKAEGCQVEEVRSWRTHNRNHRGSWGPINGVMIHHTVTSGTEASVRLCYEGYSGLPGPLCHGVIAKDGTVHLVGNGRANHAGLGDDNVMDAVIAERSALPSTNERNVDGNARFYGFECINLGDGDDPWPDAQLEAIERASAAICRHYGWSAESVIGHKEWSYTKVDPRGFSMEGMRRRVQARLDHSPTQQEDDMPSAQDVARSVADLDAYRVPWEPDGNPTWTLQHAVESLWRQSYRTEKAVQELAARGAARDAVLAHLTTGGGLEGAELTAAAEAGADRALAKLGEKLTNEGK